MAYWIVKTEPDAYSWQQLVADGRTRWDGVRNYAARNNLRAMHLGDLVLVYHSNIGKELIGLATVVAEHYPDLSAPDAWSCVDLGPLYALNRTVSLAELKADGRFAELGLVKTGRLSVMPVTEEQFRLLMQLAQTPLP